MVQDKFVYRDFLQGLEGEDQEYLSFLREKEVRRKHWKS